MEVVRTMMTLGERYDADPTLLDVYSKKLLKPGWAGAMDDVERQFVAATRREQGRKPRGKPFQPKTSSPSQRPAPVERDEEESADPSPPRMEQAAS